MTEPLANVYLSESTWRGLSDETNMTGFRWFSKICVPCPLDKSSQRRLSNEYQHDRALMVFKDLSIPVLRMKVASALEGLRTRVLCKM